MSGNKIAAGGAHTVAIKSDGTLWAWGYNGYGQLGDGTTVLTKNTPTQIGTGTTWSAIAAGEMHTIALRTDGTLWAWGWNNGGQLGNGTTVLTKNTPTQIGTGATWSAISAGSLHTVALKSDGTLWTWGENTYGQLGDGTTVNKNIPTQIGTGTTWSAISAGNIHTIALKSDGTLWAWGRNTQGQLGDGTTLAKNTPIQIGTGTTWSKVGAGSGHTLAIKTNGTLWAWGQNNFGQLGLGYTVNTTTPTQIGTGTTWSAIAAGQLHTIALKLDGTLWTCGDNTNGQLGDGTTAYKLTLTQITGNSWSAITAGNLGDHTIAIKSDGSLWSWGLNGNGQLGDGTTVNKNIPTQIVF
jgi:alpha-tubulin suppressor-like RCC1 family protein